MRIGLVFSKKNFILGNDMAQKTFGILRKRASAAKKHKPRVLVYLSLKGIRVVSEKTATLLVESPINKITFLTRDLACQRTYGIVVCTDSPLNQFSCFFFTIHRIPR